MTSKAYILPGTTTTFRDSAGDVTLTLASLASAAGRQSAQHDLGSGARAFTYNWRAFVKFATAPVVGETVNIYLKTSDGTNADNDDGTGDLAVSAEDKLKNLTWIGSIVVDEASTTAPMVASGTIAIYHRYVQVVFWNATADGLSSTAADNGFDLEPIPMQGQDT
jgi:hypothetical protein